MKLQKKNNKKGFTLIELIVVIAILAILVAVAVPNYISVLNRAQDATYTAAAAQYVNAVNVHNTLAATDSDIDAIDNTAADLDAIIALLDTTDLTPSLEEGTDKAAIFVKISIDGTGFATLDASATVED